LFTELQDRGGMTLMLWSWSGLFAIQGQYENAARMQGAYYGLSKQVGRLSPLHGLWKELRLEALRAAVGAEVIEPAFEAGCRMSLDEAIEYGRRQLAVPVSVY
jgi:hypothetical protein